MNCVHDPWHKTDQFAIAIICAWIAGLGAFQAYRAGQRAERQAQNQTLVSFYHTQAVIEARQQSKAYKAGFEACQAQF